MTDAEAKQLLADELRHVRQDRLDLFRQRDLLLKMLKEARPIIQKWCYTQGGSRTFHEDTLRPFDAAIAECESPTPPAAQ